MKEFEPIVDSFETGNWIRIKTDGKLYRLRLIEYEIDFENPENIAVTFSDVTKIQGGYSDIESILNQASSMATSYDYVARQSKAGKSAREIVDGWVDRGLALTTQKIINDADNQSITMDSNGLLCKEYDSITDTFNDNQVKIINKGLYITNDNWKTAKAGIGAFTYTDPKSKKVVSSYGVIADTIVGKIILSENVGIYNSGNSVQIDKDGFVVTFPSSNIPDNIFKIRKETTTGEYQNLLYVDEKGDLTLSGKVYASGGTFAGSLSAATGTFKGELSAATGTFKGSLSAATGTFAGNLSAAGGTFAGSLSAATGTFKGELSAATGTFKGSLSAATGTFAGNLSAAGGTFAGSLSAATGTFTGEITATKLTLDGCQIPYSSVSDKPDLTVYIAKNGKIGTGSFANDGNVNGAFKVSSNGLLQAKNAVIYGTVYASGGEIGGFSLSNGNFTSGDFSITPNGETITKTLPIPSLHLVDGKLVLKPSIDVTLTSYIRFGDTLSLCNNTLYSNNIYIDNSLLVNQAIANEIITKKLTYDNPVLWEGTMFMTEDHTATFNDDATVSEQASGIVLVFSPCTLDGSGNFGNSTDYFYQTFFIPKAFIPSGSYKTMSFALHYEKYNLNGNKILKIYNNKIEGYITNSDAGTSNGITYNNKRFILRKVYGV